MKKTIIVALFICVGSAYSQNPAAGLQCPERFRSQTQTVPNEGDLRCEELNGVVQWTITRPEVRQRLTEYPEILYQTGQVISVVDVHGYVNVGGASNKWRKYDLPEDDLWSLQRESDRLYHGLIWLPGARLVRNRQEFPTSVGTSPMRIQGIWNPRHPDEFSIGEPPSGISLYLRLGYEAVDYTQNGYSSSSIAENQLCHPRQCASITIRISNGPVTRNPSTVLQSFDPLSDTTDLNGFMLAPLWAGNALLADELEEALAECTNFPYKGSILARNIQSRCSRHASFDQPKLLTSCFLEPALGELHGHVNWAPATYIGQLNFLDFSTDRDIDIQLSELSDAERQARFGDFDPSGRSNGTKEGVDLGFHINPILTKDSQADDAIYKGNLQLEFASYELTDFFRSVNDPPGYDWGLLRYDGSSRDARTGTLRTLLRNRTAIATGLLNLDCVHECHTELHPVLALAVRTKCERTGGMSKQACQSSDIDIQNDDPWMILVRNMGNEGSCALDEHFLDRNSYSFFLPAPPNVPPGIPAAQGNFYASEAGLRWKIFKGPGNQPGALIKFFLTRGDCSEARSGTIVRIHGVLHLYWTNLSDVPSYRAAATPGTATGCTTNDRTISCDDFPVTPLAEGEDIPVECPQAAPNPELYTATQRHLLASDPGPDNSSLLSFFSTYVSPNFTPFYEKVRFGNRWLQGPGGRFELFQTPLGSVEIEGAYSTRLQSLIPEGRIWAGEWKTGLRIQVLRAWSAYFDIKFGMVYRGADNQALVSPAEHFRGHDSFFYPGFGIQTFRDRPISLRASIGDMILPGTGEHAIQFTVGPEFRFRFRRKKL